jgi:hypothetical protein
VSGARRFIALRRKGDGRAFRVANRHARADQSRIVIRIFTKGAANCGTSLYANLRRDAADR